MDKIYQTYLKIIGVFLSLYLFLVGIKGLSSGIKNLGGDFAKEIMTTTSDPFIALFIGLIINYSYCFKYFNSFNCFY